MFSALLRQSRALVLWAVSSAIVSGLATAGLLALVHLLLQHEDAKARLGWIFAALCICMPLSRLLSQVLLMDLAQKTTLALRVRLAEQILNTEIRALEEIGSHRLVAVLTEDVSAIANGLISLPALALQGAVIGGCLGYIGWLSWKLLLGVVVFIGGGMASVQIGVHLALRHLRLARQREDHMFRNLKGLTEGAKELKLNHQRRLAFFHEVYEKDAQAFHRSTFIGNSILAFAVTWAHLLFFLLTALLLFWVPRMHVVTLNVLNGYIIALLYLLVPLDTLGSLLPGLGRSRIALKNVQSLGLSLANATEDRAQSETPMRWGPLHLTGVKHTYFSDQDERFTLGPIDIEIEPGRLVFIAGGNGSGKTTLMKLIVGLYPPEEGIISLNGTVVTDLNRASYRQNFSVAFADFFLFDDLLGLQSPDLDAIAHSYLVRLRLEHKLKVLDGRFSTTELSHGQRKRLALLTVYLEDRPVCVFDEWAADQDPSFKDFFYRQLLPELQAKGKGVVVISHDDRYFDRADRLIKLDDGKIVFDSAVGDISVVASLPGVR